MPCRSRREDENATHVASRISHLLGQLDGEHVADLAHFAVEREAFNVNVGRAQDLAGRGLIDAAALEPYCKGEYRTNEKGGGGRGCVLCQRVREN